MNIAIIGLGFRGSENIKNVSFVQSVTNVPTVVTDM